MKILMVNKFHYIKGGSETYYFALKNLLETHGHTVVDFSMKDEKNFKSPYEKFFVSHVDYSNASNVFAKIRMAMKIIYSFEAKNKFEALVKKEKPDIIHLHIFQHQISPSILDIAKKYSIPTVYTAHDLKMLCLNYKMMHHGKLCEECKGGHFFHCALNKCVKDSFFKSCINVAEGYLHKWRKSYDVITRIITPSAFYKYKFEEFGINSKRVVHIPNFLDADEPQINRRKDCENYYLYFGRLSEEKGILTLLKAFQKINADLYIVGTGPLKDRIKSFITSNKLDNIKVLGFMSGRELKDIVGNSKAVLLPSEWYENGPYSAIEALQLGRPIIGAKIGGIPELVDGNGFLFSSKNAQELIECLEKFENLTEDEYQKMSLKSKDIFTKNYTPVSHYPQIMEVYQKALAYK